MVNATAGHEVSRAPTAASAVIKRGWAAARASWDAMFGRKGAEEALRESERRFRDLYDDAPIAYFSVGGDTLIRRANRGATELLGYPMHELVGRPVLDLYADAPTGKAKAQEVFRRFLAGEEIRGEELEMRRADGTPVWISLSVRPARDARGRIVETRSVVVDITERKRAEEALRESQERFRSAFEHAAIGMALTGTDGHFLQVNRSLWKMLGYSQQELDSSTWQAITHPDDVDVGQNQMRRMLAGEIESSQFEKRYLHKLGHEVWGLLSFSLVRDATGNPLYFISQIQDITERKRAEKALQAAREELEAKVEHQLLRRNPYGLTFRELTVLHLVAAGRSDKEIGSELGISPLTAQKHVSNILAKMQAASRTEAASRALREGLLE